MESLKTDGSTAKKLKALLKVTPIIGGKDNFTKLQFHSWTDEKYFESF